jgi:hypothetical protein
MLKSRNTSILFSNFAVLEDEIMVLNEVTSEG